MGIGPDTVKIRVLILTTSFVITGTINIPADMRLSDSLNKFMKDQTFLAVTNAKVKAIGSNATSVKMDFILVNKNLLIGISPLP